MGDDFKENGIPIPSDGVSPADSTLSDSSDEARPVLKLDKMNSNELRGAMTKAEQGMQRAVRKVQKSLQTQERIAKVIDEKKRRKALLPISSSPIQPVTEGRDMDEKSTPSCERHDSDESFKSVSTIHRSDSDKSVATRELYENYKDELNETKFSDSIRSPVVFPRSAPGLQPPLRHDMSRHFFPVNPLAMSPFADHHVTEPDEQTGLGVLPMSRNSSQASTSTTATAKGILDEPVGRPMMSYESSNSLEPHHVSESNGTF